MKKFYSVILWGICIAAAVGLLILLGSLMSDESMTSEKPVIYLYPEQEQEVSVRLDYDGELTCTYPEYKDGWTVTAEEDAFSFGKKATALGITDAVFTDVGRDGALIGVNLEATVKMAETGLNVIASGGIRSMEDLEALKKNNVYGAILGRSVYEGTIDLTKAIEEFEC